MTQTNLKILFSYIFFNRCKRSEAGIHQGPGLSIWYQKGISKPIDQSQTFIFKDILFIFYEKGMVWYTIH